MTKIFPGTSTNDAGDITSQQINTQRQLEAMSTALWQIVSSQDYPSDNVTKTPVVFVDPVIGKDIFYYDLNHPHGKSRLSPFKTIQMAALHMARLSLQPGADLYSFGAIAISVGRHTIYNDNGLASANGITRPADGSVVDAAFLEQFNIPNAGNRGGVILGRGLSLIGQDLRHTWIHPWNLGNNSNRLTIFRLSGGCFLTGHTYGDTQNPAYDVAGGWKTPHVWTNTHGEVSGSELEVYYNKIAILNGVPGNTAEASDLEWKIVADFSSVSSAAVDDVGGASAYIFSCSLRSRYGLCGVDWDGSKIAGFRSFLAAQFTNASQCVYGSRNANGELVDVNGHPKQLATDNASGEIGGYRIKGTRAADTEDWRHFAFRAKNQAFFQLVSCFVIGDAIDFWAQDGGEFSITNSNSNFGDVTFQAEGFRAADAAGNPLRCTATNADYGAFPQDTGISWVGVRPPLPLDQTVYPLPFSYVDSTETFSDYVTIKLSAAPTALDPFTLKANQPIYFKYNGAEYSAIYLSYNNSTRIMTLSATDNGYSTILSPLTGDLRTTAIGQLQGTPVYLKRYQDSRSEFEKNYHIKVTVSAGKRPPIARYILRIQKSASGQSGLTQFKPGAANMLPYVVATKQADSSTAYYTTILNADTNAEGILQGIDLLQRDTLSLLDNDPSVVDVSTIEDAVNTASYNTVIAVLQRFNAANISTIMGANTDEYIFSSPYFLEFNRPSIIGSGNHFQTLKGFRNYSWGLPQFQPNLLGQGLSPENALKLQISKYANEKAGGWIYWEGLDENGFKYSGTRRVDLATGDESDLRYPALASQPGTSSNSFKNLTVTDNLTLNGRLTLGLSSALANATNPPLGWQANTTNFGLVKKASQTDVNNSQGGGVVTAEALGSFVDTVLDDRFQGKLTGKLRILHVTGRDANGDIRQPIAGYPDAPNRISGDPDSVYSAGDAYFATLQDAYNSLPTAFSLPSNKYVEIYLHYSDHDEGFIATSIGSETDTNRVAIIPYKWATDQTITQTINLKVGGNYSGARPFSNAVLWTVNANGVPAPSGRVTLNVEIQGANGGDPESVYCVGRNISTTNIKINVSKTAGTRSQTAILFEGCNFGPYVSYYRHNERPCYVGVELQTNWTNSTASATDPSRSQIICFVATDKTPLAQVFAGCMAFTSGLAERTDEEKRRMTALYEFINNSGSSARIQFFMFLPKSSCRSVQAAYANWTSNLTVRLSGNAPWAYKTWGGARSITGTGYTFASCSYVESSFSSTSQSWGGFINANNSTALNTTEYSPGAFNFFTGVNTGIYNLDAKDANGVTIPNSTLNGKSSTGSNLFVSSSSIYSIVS